MKKAYIIPKIECEELIDSEEFIATSLEQIQSTQAQGQALGKERNNVDFSDDESIW